jgi:hypothetical protein
MIGDKLNQFKNILGFNNSKNLNRGKNKLNVYEPLAYFANQISQNFSTAEEKTVSAAAATEEPTDQVGRVLKKTALLILGENGEIPNLTKEEAKIAEAFFKARMLIQKTEKNACNLTQNLLGEEAPIRQIAAGRLRAISHKEQMSPPLPLPDPVTPEGVVQIGKDSLAKAGGEIKKALDSLGLTAKPQEIPPILRALAKAIDPSREPVINEEKFLKNFDKKAILKLNDENYINQIPREVDPITGLTAGSSNPT